MVHGQGVATGSRTPIGCLAEPGSMPISGFQIATDVLARASQVGGGNIDVIDSTLLKEPQQCER